MEIKREEGELTEEEQTSLGKKYQAARSYVALSHETLNLFGYISSGCDDLLVHGSLGRAQFFYVFLSSCQCKL